MRTWSCRSLSASSTPCSDASGWNRPWIAWACAIARIISPGSSPAANSSASRWLARWPESRCCCWPMNPPEISTRKTGSRCCPCWRACTRVARRSAWSPQRRVRAPGLENDRPVRWTHRGGQPREGGAQVKALLDLILLAALGLFVTCSTRNAERLSSHPNPVSRAIWRPPMDDQQLTSHVPNQRDPEWWLEALNLRPHVVRAAKHQAVAGVAARSLQRALALSSTFPTVEPLPMPHPCAESGNDG